MTVNDNAPCCSLCGDPMPAGEEMFNYHGYSGPCQKPPLPATDPTQAHDPHVDRLVALIERSLANGGCSNCGGLPHTTTCRVGRLHRAFLQSPAVGRESTADDGREANPAPQIKELTDLLQDCEIYFDDKADVRDGSEGEPIANREISLLTQIRAVLAQVQK